MIHIKLCDIELQTEDAINSNTLIKYAAKYNKYIDDDVGVIGGNLSAAVLINIEALLILEVHGELNKTVVEKFSATNECLLMSMKWAYVFEYFHSFLTFP